jgi:predicted transcriptional regulator
MDEKTLREALRVMLDSGATQQEIADKAGLSQNCISRFLHGTNDISLSRGLRLLKVVLEEQTKSVEPPPKEDCDAQ